MTVFRTLLLACLLAVPAWAAPFTAFREGETFTYKIGFAIFTHAGEITISAHDDRADHHDLVRVTTDTTSMGFVRSLYAFDNRAEVVIDRATSRLQSVKEKGEDPKRATDTELDLDYSKGVAHYTDRVRKERSATVTIPPGDPVDLISALVQTRDWNLKPGEKHDLLVQFGQDFLPISIYADHYEEVKTPLGRYNALVLVPRMDKNPTGIFKRGGEIKVWIAQDATRLPVKMQLKLNFGTVSLSLIDYKEPATMAEGKSPSSRRDEASSSDREG
ncbi:MAG TPA: DUF3108 domain-containing protein [Candidatus Didemnitutus sp.]|nr:DUF3108 domain-containing protein [Candidatus Didemnitutus sp.]